MSQTTAHPTSKAHELSAHTSKPAAAPATPAPPATGHPDQVMSLPGLTSLTNVQFAGYAPIGDDASHTDEGLFYWFVGADDYANKPTVLWTNGGPGSSSFWGFFLENGPYEVVSAIGQYPQIQPRPTGWNNYANYIIFEHPLSVTLSFANNTADVPKNPEQGAKQWHHALRHFLKQHPEIARNPFILAGESYAGTYLPMLANHILNSTHEPKIDLRATVLLDAWVNPMVQMAQDTTYAFTHGLISAAQKKQLDAEYQGANLANINSAIATISGVYMANIAQTADPCFDPVLLYLNRADVRQALHITNETQLTDTWSPEVSNNYTPYVNESAMPYVQQLLDQGQQVQVISGLNDAKDCNFLGTGAWLDLLTGPAADQFQATAPTQWLDPATNVIGFDQDGGQLSWLKVLNAGHLAVHDQPQIIEIILKKALS